MRSYRTAERFSAPIRWTRSSSSSPRPPARRTRCDPADRGGARGAQGTMGRVPIPDRPRRPCPPPSSRRSRRTTPGSPLLLPRVLDLDDLGVLLADHHVVDFERELVLAEAPVDVLALLVLLGRPRLVDRAPQDQ